jgi:hypothetical protein
MELTKFTLPAGAVCRRNGLPFALVAETEVLCHPDNWPLIRDGFSSTVSYGPTCCLSHALQSFDSPSEAQAEGEIPTAISSSLESSADLHRSRT